MSLAEESDADAYDYETHGFFAVKCNVCFKIHKCDTDACQVLPCKHLYVEKLNSKDKKKFPSKFDEMCYRMKALRQGNDDNNNKRMVDAYYMKNAKFA